MTSPACRRYCHRAFSVPRVLSSWASSPGADDSSLNASVSCSRRRSQKTTTANNAPRRNGSRHPQLSNWAVVRVCWRVIRMPSPSSWPQVMDTYWKDEPSPRRFRADASVRYVALAAYSPPMLMPWSSRASSSTRAPKYPAWP